MTKTEIEIEMSRASITVLENCGIKKFLDKILTV